MLQFLKSRQQVVTDRPQRSRRHTSTRSISRPARSLQQFLAGFPSRRPGVHFANLPAQPSSPRPLGVTPASPGSASRGLLVIGGDAGRTSQPGTFSALSVPGQKRLQISLSEEPVFLGISERRLTWPQTILFGQASLILLRGGYAGIEAVRAAPSDAVSTHPAARQEGHSDAAGGQVHQQRRQVPLRVHVVPAANYWSDWPGSPLCGLRARYPRTAEFLRFSIPRFISRSLTLLSMGTAPSEQKTRSVLPHWPKT